MKVPHGESPQLRKVAAQARVDQGPENHAGSRYHDRVAAATGPNSNRYEPVRLFILLPGRSDSVAKHRGALQLIRARGIVVVTSLLQPPHAVARLGRVGLGQRGRHQTPDQGLYKTGKEFDDVDGVPGRASRERAVELPRGAVTAAGRADGQQLPTIKRWGERC